MDQREHGRRAAAGIVGGPACSGWHHPLLRFRLLMPAGRGVRVDGVT